MLEPLEMAIATYYAEVRQRTMRRAVQRKGAKKAGWGLLFWIIGIGFLI